MSDKRAEFDELGFIFGGTIAAVAGVLFTLTFVPERAPEERKEEPAPVAVVKEVAPVVEENPSPVVAAAAVVETKPLTFDEQLKVGGELFAANCSACHRANGEGMPGMFPPLAKSDFLMADKARSVTIVIKGLSGAIEVNGAKFNSMMPPVGAMLSDDQVAAVLTYVRNSFGNKGEPVKREEVAAARNATGI